ncbi:triose-phosphate isomerase [Anaerolineales bacterium HSG6]|nr:triose-phosphate isomerase [Anaerolineales bacterium HSG6]MDM8531506.1 triose-phosphate isomerase [Anaerolineales bacterium HSG25]
MRTPIIAGNWKMHKTAAEAVLLAREIREAVTNIDKVETVLCPPFTALGAVKGIIADSNIGLGAQNLHWEEQGAYTGEVSPLMLAGLCDYVIIGHSERRQYFGETDETVNKKIKSALAHGLKPIVCVGENLDQYEAGETNSFVGSQIKGAFVGLSADDASKIVVAYEPIWAIGTGRTAEPEGANEIIATSIRGTLTELYSEEVAQKIRVQYGGSVKPNNVESFMAQPDIDGALVGGASLKTDSFVALVKGAL